MYKNMLLTLVLVGTYTSAYPMNVSRPSAALKQLTRWGKSSGDNLSNLKSSALQSRAIPKLKPLAGIWQGLKNRISARHYGTLAPTLSKLSQSITPLSDEISRRKRFYSVPPQRESTLHGPLHYNIYPGGKSSEYPVEKRNIGTPNKQYRSVKDALEEAEGYTFYEGFPEPPTSKKERIKVLYRAGLADDPMETFWRYEADDAYTRRRYHDAAMVITSKESPKKYGFEDYEDIKKAIESYDPYKGKEIVLHGSRPEYRGHSQSELLARLEKTTQRGLIGSAYDAFKKLFGAKDTSHNKHLITIPEIVFQGKPYQLAVTGNIIKIEPSSLSVGALHKTDVIVLTTQERIEISQDDSGKIKVNRIW